MAKKPAAAAPLTEAQAIALLRAKAQRWIGLPNVTSVGVGYKIKAGQRTSQLSIQVTVARKLTPAELKTAGLASLPKLLRAASGQSIPIDVIERSYRPAFTLVAEPPGTAAPPPVNTLPPRVVRRRRQARVMPGISVSHILGAAGTLGAIVYDNRSGGPCILSNAHVLQGASGMPGDEVVQPGRFDDDDVASNLMGSVVRAHIGLAGDAAISSIEGRLYDENIFELGIAPRRLARAELGDVVVKSGRTTGVTRGLVVRTGVVISHDYGGTIGVRQIGGFEIGPDPAQPNAGPVSDEGDSGSVWLIEDSGAVTDIAAGLHFAVQEDALSGTEHALACNIDSVFDKLDISFTPRS